MDNNVQSDVLEHILEVTLNMAETRSLDPLLTYVLDKAIELVKAERGFIVLVDPKGDYVFPVARSRDGQTLTDAYEQISRSIVSEAIGGEKPLIVNDAISDPGFSDASSVLDLQLRSVMCVPLKTRGAVIGVLYVENRSYSGIFHESALTPLNIFSNQAAIAIDNARLNAELEARVADRTSALRDAVDQLEVKASEAVEQNRLRTRFLSELAHDVRSPLGLAITSLTTLVESDLFGPLNAEQQLWINKAVSSVDHAMALIEDIFDLAKLEMGQLRFYPERVDLPRFLEDVYQVGVGLPWGSNVVFRAEIPNDLPWIYIDQTRIRQVILNLLSNALKYTVEGSVTLSAGYVEEEDVVLISVADTGEGIPPDRQDILFERFQQVDDNESRRKQGTGLGLAIARDLVEMHGGEIWVESEPGAGSDFRFTLPATRSD
ncbi:MAG: GAF domain-containing protein [Chloroflexi bacterium]|nr:GAF domain-containing protein [Chloroflexota bacterium]